ncbi:MAG: hypothetical protein ACREAS_06550 [Nitrososphaera sp.]|nr:hypothetical protein [Thermoproteota archaeon]
MKHRSRKYDNKHETIFGCSSPDNMHLREQVRSQYNLVMMAIVDEETLKTQ